MYSASLAEYALLNTAEYALLRSTGYLLQITGRITDRDYGSTYRPTYGDKSDPGAAKAGIDQFHKEK